MQTIYHLQKHTAFTMVVNIRWNFIHPEILVAEVAQNANNIRIKTIE